LGRSRLLRIARSVTLKKSYQISLKQPGISKHPLSFDVTGYNNPCPVSIFSKKDEAIAIPLKPKMD
jgi:hypothetical protein